LTNTGVRAITVCSRCMGKILIVEDNAFLRKTIADKLSQDGHTVIQAKDGEEGLALALSQSPDVILLDIVLPKMDGLTMLSEFRKKIGTDSVPVIILSSLEDSAHQEKAKEQNVFRYLMKSNTDIESLSDTVNFVLEGEHGLR